MEIGSAASTYQVIAKLATGGMAEIYLARSAGVASVQRYVVLKRVLRERATDASFVQMFLDEARLAAQLQHPNIAQVYDVGKLGDSYFFTMEYVHGETVRALVTRAHEMRRSPPLGCVLAIAAGAAAGLHHAHTRIGIEGRQLGIVHRDVSPSNLMVGYDGSVKLVDFGVAKAADRGQETRSGAIKGKISYLSPEQARGARVDARSDLFSFGIVLWEMLTVERLYKHDSDFDSMAAIINEPPPAPSTRRRDLPPELDALVMKALAKRPEDRFQTADELAEAIERVAAQTSSPLSSSTLARFVRELFGNRPEPWIMLQRDTRTPDTVTVTSEPIPRELRIPVNDPVDRRLAAVADLSELTKTGVSVTDVDRPTAALPVALPITTSDSSMLRPAPSRRRSRLPLAIAGGLLGLAIVIAIVIANAPAGEIVDKDRAISRLGDASQPSIDPPAIVGEPDAPLAGDRPTAAIDPDAGAALDADTEPAPDDARVVAPVRERPKPKQLTAAEWIVECTAGRSTDWANCTLAACRTGDRARARRWLDKTAATRRVRIVKSCSGLGVQLAQPTKPDCDANPLACP